MDAQVPEEYPERLRSLRSRLGLTQTQLANLLGVSFATVNRWENRKAKPTLVAWLQVVRAEQEGVGALKSPVQALVHQPEPEPTPVPGSLPTDFTAGRWWLSARCGTHPPSGTGSPTRRPPGVRGAMDGLAPLPGRASTPPRRTCMPEVSAMRPLCPLMLIAVLLATGCWSAPSLQATRTSRPPVIDGQVTGEAVWAPAPPAGGFRLLGKPEVAATQVTEAYALFDERNLYFGFVCHEDRMEQLVAQVKTPDGNVWEDDCVEVFLAPSQDRGRYLHFLVNCAGVLRDELVRDEAWNSGARAATRKAEGAWSAELVIPLSSLRLDETVSATWGLNLCRGERPHTETSSWAPCKTGFHEPDSFGDLTGLNLNFAPLVVAALRDRAQAALAKIRQIEKSVREYQDLEVGRVVAGACVGHAARLEALQATATKRIDMPRARDLGAEVTRVEAAIPELQAQVLKLPLVREAGRAGYVVCPESTMVKVRPDRPYPGRPGPARVALARNEYEAIQIVVMPLKEELRKVVVAVTDLQGPRQATIPASEISVKLVGYVNVRQSSGGATLPPGLLPDPLLDNAAVDVARDGVQSWWVTVHAPRDQRPGVYRGEVTVRPRNAPETRVPLEVRVWDFALPTTSRLRSSYGLNLGSVYSKYDLATGPGLPPGWTAGAWTGADVEGRPNYFGSMKYDVAFDYEVKNEGKRSCRVRITDVQPGTHESPRFCYYAHLTDLKPQTEYRLSVWYRTAPEDKGGAAVWMSQGGGLDLPPTGGEWKQGSYAFTTGEKPDLYLYLRADKVGTVWWDNLKLAPKGASPLENALPNPSFEQGDETGRERIRDAYILDALAHRASPTNVIAPRITVGDDGTVSMDWAEFDAKMQQYIEAGLSAFNVSWCRLPSGWGTVESVQDQARIDQARQLLQQTQAHLEEKGWTHLAYIYTIDEPGWQAFGQVKQAFELAHSAAPKLKTLLTYGYGASKPIEPGAPRYADLAGCVDIHVPHSDCYEPIYLKKRQQAGDEVWAYVCISARRPYLNCWGIDYPGMDHRLLYWQLFDHEITGFLYWEIAYWQVDPWQNTLTYPGGNGDGSLIYPGKDGPVDSIRWELCRDGTEDYDMLVMLRDASAALRQRRPHLPEEALLRFPHLTKSWTEYSQNPQVLETQRLLIGNRLEALTRVLGR